MRLGWIRKNALKDLDGDARIVVTQLRSDIHGLMYIWNTSSGLLRQSIEVSIDESIEHLNNFISDQIDRLDFFDSVQPKKKLKRAQPKRGKWKRK